MHYLSLRWDTIITNMPTSEGCFDTYKKIFIYLLGTPFNHPHKMLFPYHNAGSCNKFQSTNSKLLRPRCWQWHAPTRNGWVTSDKRSDENQTATGDLLFVIHIFLTLSQLLNNFHAAPTYFNYVSFRVGGRESIFLSFCVLSYQVREAVLCKTLNRS